MHLSDSVLRKCNKETTGVGLWLKLESLYEKISHELDLFDGETDWVQDVRRRTRILMRTPMNLSSWLLNWRTLEIKSTMKIIMDMQEALQLTPNLH